MKGLAKFGHPESPKLTVRAELSADGLFKDTTRVYYAAVSAAPLPAEGAVAALDQAFELPSATTALASRTSSTSSCA